MRRCIVQRFMHLPVAASGALRGTTRRESTIMMTAAQLSSTDDSALAEHLIAAAREMDADDRESLLTVLGVIVSALHPPRTPDEQASPSVRAALRVLRDLRHPPGAPNNGVLFRGRPPWFSDRMLE